MNRNLENTSDATAADRWLPWTAIVLLGGVFFFVGHDFQISRFEGYAPWSDSDGTLASGGNAVKGLALSLIGVFGLFLFLRRDGRPIRWTGPLPVAMAFYLAWSAASILWSGDPALSCRKLAVLMFCVVGAVGFARQFRPRDIALIAAAVSAAYLAVGAAAELALGTFQPWSEGYRFAGTVHPNTQGANLTVLCLASFCLARFSPPGETRLRPLYWTLFGLGLVFLILTKSRTSCAAMAFSLAALWLICVSGRTRLLAVSAAGFLLCSAALIGSLFDLGLDDAAVRAAMLGRQEESADLTGRIPVWNELLGYVAARPLHGFGYEAFWTDGHIEELSDEMQWPLREAHNAYLDSTLSVGAVGTASLMLIVLLGVIFAARSFRATACAGTALTFCLLAFAVFNAFLETGLVAPNFVTLIAGSGIAQLLAGGAAIKYRSRARSVNVLYPHQPGATDGRGFVI